MEIENVGNLPVLLHTARTGSLTGAARVLGVTPAAASAMLKRLETKVGVRLFERSTRAMRLTPAGQTLLEYATRAFELLDEGEAQIVEASKRLVGLVRVAAPSHLARAVLLPWLDAFLALHPGVELALSVGDRPLDVLRDEVDVALRYGALADSRLVARPLLAIEPIAVASPSYLARHPPPETPADLSHHNCLVYQLAGRPHRTWRFVRDGQSMEVRVRGDRSTDDTALAHQWAHAGAGILLETPLELMQDLAKGRLVPLLMRWRTEPYPLHAILPSRHFIPARVRTLVDFLAAKLAARADELRRLIERRR